MRGLVMLGVALAAIAFALLSYVCVRVAGRRGHADPAIRGAAAAALLFGALIAVGNIGFVFVGTIDGMSDETYTGRQALYLELSLAGSIGLAILLTMAARRVLRRPTVS